MWRRRTKQLLTPVLEPVLDAALRLTSLRAGLVLVYHRLGPESGERERELAPPVGVELAREQLAHLKRRFDVVPLEHFREAIGRRRRGKRFPVAITFDDDSAEHAERAAPLLAELGLPATFFLCGPARVDDFWWQTVNRALRAGASPAELGRLLPSAGSRAAADAASVSDLGARIEALSEDERNRFARSLQAEVGVQADQAETENLPQVLRAGGFGIGFHPVRHERLTQLGDEALTEAMSYGLDELEEAAGHPIEAIAYPHGAADRRVAEHAAKAGFRVGFTTMGVPATPSDDPLMTGRSDVHDFGTDPRDFRLRLMGKLAGARKDRGPGG